jgi:hypothetical protein
MVSIFSIAMTKLALGVLAPCVQHVRDCWAVTPV